MYEMHKPSRATLVELAACVYRPAQAPQTSRRTMYTQRAETGHAEAPHHQTRQRVCATTPAAPARQILCARHRPLTEQLSCIVQRHEARYHLAPGMHKSMRQCTSRHCPCSCPVVGVVRRQRSTPTAPTPPLTPPRRAGGAAFIIVSQPMLAARQPMLACNGVMFCLPMQPAAAAQRLLRGRALARTLAASSTCHELPGV